MPSAAAHQVPLSATVLLLLAAFFSVAAWEALGLNRDTFVSLPSTAAVPAESISRGTYQAHRHEAVILPTNPRVRLTEQLPEKGDWHRGQFSLVQPIAGSESIGSGVDFNLAVHRDLLTTYSQVKTWDDLGKTFAANFIMLPVGIHLQVTSSDQSPKTDAMTEPLH